MITSLTQRTNSPETWLPRWHDSNFTGKRALVVTLESEIVPESDNNRDDSNHDGFRATKEGEMTDATTGIIYTKDVESADFVLMIPSEQPRSSWTIFEKAYKVAKRYKKPLLTPKRVEEFRAWHQILQAEELSQQPTRDLRIRRIQNEEMHWVIIVPAEQFQLAFRENNEVAHEELQRQILLLDPIVEALMEVGEDILRYLWRVTEKDPTRVRHTRWKLDMVLEPYVAWAYHLDLPSSDGGDSRYTYAFDEAAWNEEWEDSFGEIDPMTALKACLVAFAVEEGLLSLDMVETPEANELVESPEATEMTRNAESTEMTGVM